MKVFSCNTNDSKTSMMMTKNMSGPTLFHFSKRYLISSLFFSFCFRSFFIVISNLAPLNFVFS